MYRRFGKILERARAEKTRVQFAQQLGLSNTFVRAMEVGLRLPSDRVLFEIAEKLGLDPESLLLAAYCDRSEALADLLRRRGVIQESAEEPAPDSAPGGERTQPQTRSGQPYHIGTHE